jgi:ribonuclease HI
MPWLPRILRGNRVYARAHHDGSLATDERGRVDVVYKLAPGAKRYRAGARNLEPTGDPQDDVPFEAEGMDGAASEAADIPPGAIVIYTDGSCIGNPGPMGLGVVIADGEERRELKEFLGTGTNNIAELVAIERALEAIAPTDRQRAVYLHSDSSYAIGLLSKGWKAKANAEVVARIRSLIAEFPDLHFVKVRGHAGIPDNERCDELAREAIAEAR